MISALLTLALIQQSQELIPVHFDQEVIKPADGDEVGIIETTKGKIIVMFFPQVAPNHVKNFIKLSKDGFYNGTRFHRCIPGFMIQGGDPNSRKLDASDLWGTGGPIDSSGNRLSVNAEFSKLKHLRGVLSMARSSDPNSAGSQFFIMQANYPSLDGKYSAFGKVLEGMDVVDEIVKLGNREDNGSVVPKNAVEINTVTIEKWPLKN
jgi:peptidyl-prolyl cis-trans isomerase B (cyclophilin B)